MTATLPPTDPAAVQARLDDLFRSIDPDAPADRASALLRRYVEDYRLQRDAVPAAGATPEVP
ncbi:hypothetical protein QPK32_19165 [Massilia sp. YIM B02763]|uniref:hypothetical protein n=1 Tax=Massilia sp. YIM B02763 TaxID=3050130 RepID=UPI0025B71CF8|nr:hypothetical protein [Massilia sp. YIM B02763]MDN4055199.1 hypothetical protein [Massilia sp. YIM B02763]